MAEPIDPSKGFAVVAAIHLAAALATIATGAGIVLAAGLLARRQNRGR
jgi:hypothetical protein